MTIFNYGDKVIVTDKRLKTFGKVGVVVNRSLHLGTSTVAFESGTYTYSNNKLSLYKEPVKEQEKKPSLGFYVFNETCRNSPKKTHDTRDLAEAEAKRLAGKQPAHTFSVLEIVSEFKAEVTVKQTK